MSAPTWSQDAYLKAWHVATLAHHGQMYAGSVAHQQFAYINHLGSVTMELIWALHSLEHIQADVAVQCALLHDILEDTDYTYQQLQQVFNQDVAAGVLALTKNTELVGKRVQMLDSLTRIQQQPHAIWLVKLADRITNMSAPPHHWSMDKRRLYQEEARLILHELGSASQVLSTRLAQRIEAYHSYIY